MEFFTTPDGTGSLWWQNPASVTILGDGRVGINTNAPAATLDVNGSAIVRTNLTVNEVVYFKTNTVVTAPAAGFGGMYVDAQTNYWFWHSTGIWTNKLW